MEMLPQKQNVKEGKLLAVLSHLWFVGTVIAWILNLKKNNDYASFYTRQMIGWHFFTGLNVWIVFKFLNFGFLKWLFGVVLGFLWFLSLLYTLSGKKKAIPLIGDKIQQWFKSL